ncbi:Na(+)/H(+) antiporter NhaA, partial [Staphylococcus hominis]
VVDTGGFREMIVDPVAMGIYLGLPLGEMLGISGGVVIMVKLFKLKLGRGVNMLDILPVSLVAGIGFTVSLLIATLSFPASDPHEPHSRIAVLVGTLLSAIVGGAVLAARSKWRNRYAVRTEIHTSM